MTRIMISIQPKWVEKILNLEKKAEIRKTVPKAPFPLHCFIYETGGVGVVAEFICDGITQAKGPYIDKEFLTDTCLTVEEAREYAGDDQLFKWRIRSLISYGQPKKLRDFGLEQPPQSWCYLKDGDPYAQEPAAPGENGNL